MPTLKKVTSQVLCVIWVTSLNCGGNLNIDKAKEALDKHISQDDVHDTFQRTLAHGNDNRVDYSKTPFLLRNYWKSIQKMSLLSGMKASHMLSREYRKPFEVPASGQV